MLYALTQWLEGSVGIFRIFDSITMRLMLSLATALMISLAYGHRVIRWLAAKKIGQPVRTDGPETHAIKTGTPTMGGILILFSVGVATLLWGDLTNRYLWTVLVVTLGFGIVGWYDDWKKVVYRDPNGLAARWKFFWQSVLGLGAAVFLFYTVPDTTHSLNIPFLKNGAIPLGAGFIVLCYLVIVGTSNAVNLTDGLDGLAIMPSVMVASAFGVIAYVTGNTNHATYLNLAYLAQTAELCIVLGAIVGAGLGFLWFNAYPAEVFMGDVGALALGACLGCVAVIVHQEIVLFIMGGVFVVETLSVIIQVGWFKYTKRRYGTGRRIMLMAPLHHHFEKKGWKETQVVVRFWIITIMLIVVGLGALKLR